MPSAWSFLTVSNITAPPLGAVKVSGKPEHMLASLDSAYGSISLGASAAATHINWNAQLVPYDLSHVNNSLVDIVEAAATMTGKLRDFEIFCVVSHN